MSAESGPFDYDETEFNWIIRRETGESYFDDLNPKRLRHLAQLSRLPETGELREIFEELNKEFETAILRERRTAEKNHIRFIIDMIKSRTEKLQARKKVSKLIVAISGISFALVGANAAYDYQETTTVATEELQQSDEFVTDEFTLLLLGLSAGLTAAAAARTQEFTNDIRTNEKLADFVEDHYFFRFNSSPLEEDE